MSNIIIVSIHASVAKATTSNTITIDNSAFVTPGGTLKLTIQHLEDDSIETQDVSSVAKPIITISGTFDTTPSEGDHWHLYVEDTEEWWKITHAKIEEDLQVTVSAVEYNANVY